MWVINGLTTSYTPPCPYKQNSAASREYQSLSGCNSAIPIEQSFSGSGSNCGHWEESCLGQEIMTPAANGQLTLSRITIAGLEDLGYQVNYNVAQTYRATELSSRCTCRRLRRDLGDYSNSTQQPERRLSEEGERIATEYGKALLEMNRASTSLIPGEGDLPDMGTELIYVLYEEPDGEIFSVMVRADS